MAKYAQLVPTGLPGGVLVTIKDPAGRQVANIYPEPDAQAPNNRAVYSSATGGLNPAVYLPNGTYTVAWSGGSQTVTVSGAAGEPPAAAYVDQATQAELDAAGVAASGTYPTVVDMLAKDRIVERGTGDLTRSVADSRVDYEDAFSFYEDWVDLSDWTASVDTSPAIAVSGGRVYGTSGTKPNIAKAFTFQATGRGRVKSLIRFVAGGAARNSVFGFSSLASGAARTNDLNDFVGAGIFYNGSSAQFISYDRGSANFGPNMGSGSGTYIVTLYRDEFVTSATVTNGAGTTEWGVTVPAASYTPQQLEWWSSDARGTSGDSLDPVTGRGATVTHSNRVNETSLLAPVRSTLLGNNIHVATPASYDSRKPHPLAIYFHGHGGTELSVTQPSASSNVYNTYAELVANGYIVASSSSGGSGEEGTGYAAYVDLYKYVRDHFAIGPVVFIAESFGGIDALVNLAQRTIPNVAAFVGFYPVTNLASVYANNPTLKTAIDTAYGIPGSGTYAVRTYGYDPNLVDARLFRGTPMLLRHSAGDTTVLKADNADLFATKLAAYNTVTVEATTGNHGDASNFGSILTFLNGALGR